MENVSEWRCSSLSLFPPKGRERRRGRERKRVYSVDRREMVVVTETEKRQTSNRAKGRLEGMVGGHPPYSRYAQYYTALCKSEMIQEKGYLERSLVAETNERPLF